MSDDIIGYGKPPKHYQFKKGKSGNPRGRPKGEKSKGHLAILDHMLSEKIDVREGGQQKKITKQEALLKKLFIDSMNGDKASIKIMLRYVEELSTLKGDIYPQKQDQITVRFVSPKIIYESDEDPI